jgi:cytosine/adenosine deaminase-related metal-dependent hydrolase
VAAKEPPRELLAGRGRVLFRGGYVLTMDPHYGDLVGDGLVVGDRIAGIGTDLEAGGAVVVDVAERIVAPGFVDSHVHACEGAIRGIVAGGRLRKLHGDYPRRRRQAHGARGHCGGAAPYVAQALNGGVTTIVDNSHNSRTPEHSDAAIEALEGTGVRAVHAVGSPAAGEAGRQLPGDLLRLRDQYFRSRDQLLTLRLFDMTPSPETWKFAAEHGLDVVAEMGMWIPRRTSYSRPA